MDLYKVKYTKYLEGLSEEEKEFLYESFYDKEDNGFFVTLDNLDEIEAEMDPVEREKFACLFRSLRKIMEDEEVTVHQFELW